MNIEIKDLEYSFNCWRGSVVSDTSCSLWRAEQDDFGGGFPRLVYTSEKNEPDIELLVNNWLAKIFSKYDQIEELIFSDYNLAEKENGFISLSDILIPPSSEFFILNFAPLGQYIHNYSALVLDCDGCVKGELVANEDVFFVNADKAADLWRNNFENWREYEFLNHIEALCETPSMESFPEITSYEEKVLLRPFKKTNYGYEREVTFEDGKMFATATCRITTDDMFKVVKPTILQIRALSWILENTAQLEESILNELKQGSLFNEEELQDVKLTEIFLSEEPLKKISFIFSSNKFDYDEHGLGLIWSQGKIVYRGHAMDCY